MTVPRKRHPEAFKARGVLEAAKRTRTLAELSAKFFSAFAASPRRLVALGGSK